MFQSGRLESLSHNSMHISAAVTEAFRRSCSAPVMALQVVESTDRPYASSYNGCHCWLVQQCVPEKHCWASQQWHPINNRRRASGT